MTTTATTPVQAGPVQAPAQQDGNSPTSTPLSRAAARQQRQEEQSQRKQARAAASAQRELERRRSAEAGLISAVRRQRLTSPEGKQDQSGRWHPSDREWSSHMGGIRAPSRAWPWTYLKASSARSHIACLSDEEPEYYGQLLREALSKLNNVEPCQEVRTYIRLHPHHAAALTDTVLLDVVLAMPTLAAATMGDVIVARDAVLAALSGKTLLEMAAVNIVFGVFALST